LGVRNAKRIQQVFSEITTAIDQEKTHMNALGAVYAQLGSPASGASLNKVAAACSLRDLKAIAERLESRIKHEADAAIRTWIEEVRTALNADDACFAERASKAGAASLSMFSLAGSFVDGHLMR
jgi:HPt (histidine-containing phosphotransfer) domain-containing protein